jgi:hypothetical protein
MKIRRFKMFFIGPLVLAVFSAVVMLLWNLLMPAILGLSTINFWQALGLFILSRILFGSFGGGRMMMGGMFFHHGNPFRDKWMNMTAEQRKEFINKRRKFGFGGGFHHHGEFFHEGFDEESNKHTPDNNE